ncbi:phage head spike fiber domain-containing protein [Aeromonas hydrophila]|uniref:phage head spike fiber domain-containing protein n=1 Tax=Aeromonas hydrophila TaxID=644 RepID=UPI002B061160|nr:hypothetical protein [Aeromonas hydrophila]
MAVTDKDPTEAILLVEQTIGTFNQIVVGQEGQMVPVPGYPDQPTLAERVKQNLKPSTDAAAGFAAQASASAKAADDAAKLASQISGLETVADAIGMAALPMPDVWAPLTDSLRLVVGNGREVKVGDDVVARYVNYSRSTAATYTDKNDDMKVAAINEPRFERNGLLIGGGNPNLFNKSAASSYSWISSVLSQSAGSAQLPFDVFQKTITSSNSAQGSSERVIVDLYSISNPAALAGGPVTVSAYMFGDADAIVSASPELKIVADLSITGISRSVIKINSNTVRIIWSGVITPGSSSTFGNFQVTWLNRLQSVVVGCYQITMLPFVDSYIPTNGASATRAPDVVTLPQSLNLVEAQLGFSLAVEFDTVNTGPHRILELSDFSSIIADGASLTIRHAGKEVYGINAPLGQRHHIAYSVAADGAITVALNGRVLAPQSK